MASNVSPSVAAVPFGISAKWEAIRKAAADPGLKNFGQRAVDENNRKEKTEIVFIGVVSAERKESVGGRLYRLWIHGYEDKKNEVDKVYHALVFVENNSNSVELKSFDPIEWME